MANTNVTTLDSSLQPTIIRPWYATVQYATPSGETYAGASFKTLSSAIVERITLKVGPDASEAVIFIPVDASETDNAGGVRGVFDHKVYEPDAGNIRLSPFRIPGISLGLMSKIRIFATPQQTLSDLTRNLTSTPRLFVGYVVDIETEARGHESSGMRIVCRDARELLRKTPVQGVVFYNPEHNKHVYIRDADVIFNDGMRPTRYHNTNSNYTSEQMPRFINYDYGRFVNDAASELNGWYIHDAWLYNQEAPPGGIPKIPAIHARKWHSGHVWNYCANVCAGSTMQGSFDEDLIERLYDDPATALTQDDLPPLHIDTEVDIPVLSKSGNLKDMYHDFFEPRALIGAVNQTGLADAVSAVGEWDVTGQPVIEVLFDTCRRTGNYSIAGYFTKDDKLRLEPIRTVQGYTESRTAQHRDVPVGLRGRSTDGKKLVVSMPNTAGTKPHVHAFKLHASADSYYNRFHIKGGPRVVQMTFMTLAPDGTWTDNVSTPYLQLHQPYEGDAFNEWMPKALPDEFGTPTPSLRPGWDRDDQTAWIEIFDGGGDIGQYPDVFRTWIVPETIDWVAFWGVTDDGETSVDETIGFRRFFERDRQVLSELITSAFDTTIGLYRSRRKQLPIRAWRAFRGIRTDSDGNTAYGDMATTENIAVQGQRDWYLMPASYEVLTDGRFGFQLGPEARNSRVYPFENHPPFPTDMGNRKTPASWNGLVSPGELQGPADARSYEMMFTIALKVDEDLWEYIRVPNSGTQSIARYGPAMELYREAGSEYRYEEAIHSMIEDPSQNTRLREMPPADGTSGDGQQDTERRIYNDPRRELAARARMMANRSAAADIEGELHLRGINPDYIAGMYISKLTRPGDKPLEINAIIDAVTHDFVNQQTSLHIATMR